MKTKKKIQSPQVKLYGDCSSQPALVMSIQSEATSSAELQEIILPMRLLLQMKQRTGLKLTARVNISIYRESTKMDSVTASSGTLQNGTFPTKDEEHFVQTTLPLTYPSSTKKRKSCGSK